MLQQRPTASIRSAPPAPEALLAEVLSSASWGAASTTEAVLAQLDVGSQDRVLEIGFGSGRTLAQVAARASRGHVVGIDASEWSLRHARLRVRRLVASGRVRLQLGRSSDLSEYPDAAFDKAYAAHVVYFWSESEGDLVEIRRVLRPGGSLLLGYRPAPQRAQQAGAGAYAPVPEVEGSLQRAGFRQIRTLQRGVGPRLRAWTHACR